MSYNLRSRKGKYPAVSLSSGMDNIYTLADYPETTADKQPIHKRSHAEMKSEAEPTPINDLEPTEPPIHTINLSLPPRQRYVELATLYRDELRSLPMLFDDILTDQGFGATGRVSMKKLTRLCLRKLYNPEQMEELKGIQEATGIGMWLLVAFNVLLDLFVGCTSGGVQVYDPRETGRRLGGGATRGRKMLHFRTLDWGMDALRKIVVQLRFVEYEGGPVIATSVTYLGFVGVLTGVRPGLSLSFNFRNQYGHLVGDRWEVRKVVRWISGKILVLIGWRQSTPSILRQFLIPTTRKGADGNYVCNEEQLATLHEIVEKFPPMKTSQCYLTVCDGTKATVLEKDKATAVTHSSSSFIVVTNHDRAAEDTGAAREGSNQEGSTQDLDTTGAEHFTMSEIQEILEESMSRKEEIVGSWENAKRRYLRDYSGATEDEAAVTLRRLKGWATKEPMWGNCTHYAVIMDSVVGEVVWARKWPAQEEIEESDKVEET